MIDQSNINLASELNRQSAKTLDNLLRDAIARQALNGLLSAECENGYHVSDAGMSRHQAAAKDAYDFAEAMMEERRKRSA